MDASARSDLSLPVAVWTAGLLVAACAGGGVTTPGDDEEEPGLDRSELEVTVRVSEEDRAVAEALGWEDRRVPGARVTLMRESGPAGGIFVEDSITGETGSEGTVRFRDLLPNTIYRVKVVRPLSSEEVDTVQKVRSGVRVLAGGTKGAAGRANEVTVAANRTGLMISEIEAFDPAVGEPGADYELGSYVELYNNSDRTISLDGRIIGIAFAFGLDLAPGLPCRETVPVQTSPEGIWSRFFQAFPGSGDEHTVGPGETVVVATDAIDHTKVFPLFPDLREADFEFWGPSDVDNPEVPNMERVGLQDWFMGHGLNGLAFLHASLRVVLTEPVDVDDLARGRPEPGDDDPYVLFPADQITDVVTSVDGEAEDGREYCQAILAPRFEKLAKVWTPSVRTERLVYVRRRAGEMEGGRPILLDTNTSDVDFRWDEMTPGGLPLP